MIQYENEHYTDTRLTACFQRQPAQERYAAFLLPVWCIGLQSMVLTMKGGSAVTR